MKLYTSYFAKNGIHPKAVSIAGRSPKFFNGRKYKDLNPKFWFFKKYNEVGDEIYYTTQYNKQVLDKLDPQEVVNDLGDGAVMLCWEASNKFCHRHLVALWLKEKLGIDVEEI